MLPGRDGTGWESTLHVVAAILRTPRRTIRTSSTFAPALWSVSIPYELGPFASLIIHSDAA